MNWQEFNNIFKDSELVGEKIIIKTQVAYALDFIKNNYGFEILKEIIAVDNQEEGFELIYKLYSFEDDEDVLISTFVVNEAESVSKIFDSAIADEKEIYDLFGVNCVVNTELKRLYMRKDWEGNP